MAEPSVAGDDRVAKLRVSRAGRIDSTPGRGLPSVRLPTATKPDRRLAAPIGNVRSTAGQGLGGRRGTSDGIAKMLALNGRLAS